MARFLHLADIHLGTNQYHNVERNRDFFKSFWGVVERHALEREVDFVLIAGDLFDKRQIDAPTLGQATAVLRRLQDKGIPVCCVEGNHDRAYYGEGSSWLEYLNSLGLMRLLRNDVADDGSVELRPWQPGQRPGAYTDIDDVRVIGSRYYGASTAKAIAPLAEAIKALPAVPFTVLMWHMGLEGYINPLAGGVSMNQLSPLRTCTDYLALGHVHQRYVIDDWLYNPGSLEACNVVEATLPHGAFLVTVDHSGHSVEAIDDYPRRPFRRLAFELTPFDMPAEFQDALPGFLKAELSGDFALAPVIELSLTGTCRFSRSALDLDWIRQCVVAACAPLLVLVRNLSASHATALAPDAHAAMDRTELESYILQDWFAQDTRFRQASGRCSQLLLDVKRRLENGEKAPSLLAYLKETVPEALRATAGEPPGPTEAEVAAVDDEDIPDWDGVPEPTVAAEPTPEPMVADEAAAPVETAAAPEPDALETTAPTADEPDSPPEPVADLTSVDDGGQLTLF